jgi:hypothetical protein
MFYQRRQCFDEYWSRQDAGSRALEWPYALEMAHLPLGRGGDVPEHQTRSRWESLDWVSVMRIQSAPSALDDLEAVTGAMRSPDGARKAPKSWKTLS